MRFLVDNQLPIQLANFLRDRGHDCDHVLDIGLSESDDVTVWSRAVSEGRVLISKDDDFAFLAKRPGDAGQLIWVRLGNCRNPVLIAAFDRTLASIEACLNAGQRIVEVR